MNGAPEGSSDVERLKLRAQTIYSEHDKRHQGLRSVEDREQPRRGPGMYYAVTRSSAFNHSWTLSVVCVGGSVVVSGMFFLWCC